MDFGLVVVCTRHFVRGTGAWGRENTLASDSTNRVETLMIKLFRGEEEEEEEEEENYSYSIIL